MKKKIYNSPLTELTEINLGIAVMFGTSIPDDSTPTPPGGHPGLSKRRTPVF